MKKKIENSALKKKDGRKGNGGARENSGRPSFSPNDAERKQVEALSGYGLPIEQIAMLIRDGIDADTLRKHFSNELIAGKSKANAQIGRTLFQKAIGGDTTAMIWWSKTQMRWSETQKHELTGSNGAPIEISSVIDVSKLSTEVLKQIVAAKNDSD